jgi:hypothetical protein
MRRWILAGLLAGGMLAAPAVAQGPPPLKELRWLDTATDPVQASTTRPPECLPPGRQPLSIEIGRAAFRSPLLLGGQAARAGLSCDACHRNGRTNPHFVFPGVSGAPGTADVTDSLFSSHRGDGVDNPKPIPDLGGQKARLKIDQATTSPALRAFVRGLVTEEFDGAEPPPKVLDGLVAYVRALSPTWCRSDEPVRLRVGGLAEDSRRAVRAAQAALEAGDPATALVMLDAARAPLARLDERYLGPALAGDRAAIRAASLDLGAAAADVRGGRARASERLAVWLVQSRAWEAGLKRNELRSLFNAKRLKATL